MKPEAQRIAIAEACGWKRINNHADDLESPAWLSPKGKVTAGYHWVHLPDYLNDLNAMHEAEKTLTKEETGLYQQRLIQIVVTLRTLFPKGQKYPMEGFVFHATAKQRGEAFLKAKGLWRDET